MAECTSDRFTRGISHRSSDGGNEPTGGDESCGKCDSQHGDDRPRRLVGGKHSHRTVKACATRANSVAPAAIRDANSMVGRVVHLLVEPTGCSIFAGSRGTGKGRNDCYARTG